MLVAIVERQTRVGKSFREAEPDGCLKAVKFGLAMAAVVFAFLVYGQAAYAAMITVTTTADEFNVNGNCSLREALQAANTDTVVDACAPGSGRDTIVVPAGTYNLAIGKLDIASDLTVSGAGAANTIIDGAGLFQVFDVISNSATIAGATIRHGSALSGGGVRTEVGASLTIQTSTVTDNTAGAGGGGGINNLGTLTLTQSRVTGNDAFCCGAGINNTSGVVRLEHSTVSGNTSAFVGGILNNDGATLVLKDSTVSGNSAPFGGGIWNFAGVVKLEESTVSGNSATEGSSGGIENFTGGTVTLNESTVTDNTSVFAGGIDNLGVLTLNKSEVSDNTATNGVGGGLHNDGGTLTLNQSLISGNRATGVGVSGGGIATNGGAMTLNQSLISGNRVTGPGALGGGISNGDPNLPSGAPTTTLNRSAVIGNTASSFGGGIWNVGSGRLALSDSAVVGNSAGSTGGGIFNAGGMVAFARSIVTGNIPNNCSGC